MYMYNFSRVKAGSQYDTRSCVALRCIAKSYNCKHAATQTQRKDRPKTYPCVRACVATQRKTQDLTSYCEAAFKA